MRAVVMALFLRRIRAAGAATMGAVPAWTGANAPVLSEPREKSQTGSPVLIAIDWWERPTARLARMVVSLAIPACGPPDE